MRLLCLIESLGPGGAERQMSGLAILLRRSGHDVKVVTYYPQDFYRASLNEAGVDYCYASNAQSKFKRIGVLYKITKDYKPDAIIAYLPTAELIACVIKMLGIKTKLIVSERNTTQKNNFQEFVRFSIFRLAADWVVPNSYMQESFIKTHYKRLMKKVRVITNFVDTEVFKPKGSIENLSLRILCVGRVFPQKNVYRFLDSVKLLKERGYSFRMDWFGNHSGQYAEQCISKIKELKIEDLFVFHDTSLDIIEEYQNSDVLCLPSLYEGFPNVVCEAMSCGLPVLCGRVCDNPRIVTDGENGFLFDPLDVNDIADKIQHFFSLSEEERKEMGRRNRNKAIELFSKDVFLNRYQELLNKLFEI